MNAWAGSTISGRIECGPGLFSDRFARCPSRPSMGSWSVKLAWRWLFAFSAATSMALTCPKGFSQQAYDSALSKRQGSWQISDLCSLRKSAIRMGIVCFVVNGSPGPGCACQGGEDEGLKRHEAAGIAFRSGRLCRVPMTGRGGTGRSLLDVLRGGGRRDAEHRSPYDIQREVCSPFV